MDATLPIPDNELETRLRDALAPRYILLRAIGQGGMGAVYLAREPELSRLVAVKVLSPKLAKDDTARARFVREAQAAASIAHPNVIAIHSVGALADGTPYFVMQYATGESIAARLAREGPVTTTEATRMVGELASALAAAHARGVVHRDIKPANVLYDQETGRILITDFGIAAVRAMPGAEAVPQLTGTGMMLGTPQYMSPEQLTAEPANDRTDIYGLGLVAYELLTGDGPFDVSSPMQMMAAHLRDVPRRVSAKRPEVDPDFDELVFACLAKDPAARPSAADIVRRLGAAEVILEWPPPGLTPLQGALTSVSRLFIAGGFIAAAAFLTMFSSGSGLAAQRLSLMMVLLLIATAIGATLLGAALWRLWRVATRVTRAIGLGYGWATIAETLADTRRDTGLLVAGLREYSVLTAPERDGMRRRRVMAATAGLTAGVLVLPMVVLFVWITPASESPSWITTRFWSAETIAALITLAPMLTLLWWSLRVRRNETRRLRSARGRIAKRGMPDDVTSVLVESWRRAFDTARAGQRLGTGTSGSAFVARVAVVLLAIGTVGTLVCLIPIFYVGVAGSSLWPRMGNTPSVAIKASVAETARPLALPADSSIAPLAAGDALFRLELKPGERSMSVGGFVMQPAVGPPPLLPAEFPKSLFTRPTHGADGKLVNMRGGQIAEFPNSEGIIEYAKGGFSPAERQWLDKLAASPRWALWRRYARSPRADLLAARFVLPFADTLTAWSVPIPRLSALKQYAYASVGRAALYRSRGETARADTVLRETITAGFRLQDDGSTLIEQLIGIVIIGIGHGGLHHAAVADGRPDGKEWLARVATAATYQNEQSDSLTPAVAAELDARALRRRIIAAVVSQHLRPGSRTQAYLTLSMSPCTNVRELLLGRDEDARDALKRARSTLVRFPAEAALLDIFERQPMLITVLPSDSRQKRLMMPIARLSGWVLRNPRIPGCVSTLMTDLW